MKFKLLRGAIIGKFGTLSNFADFLGISKQTLSAKLSGRNSFTTKEIYKWCDVLGIKISEVGKYFFAQ